MLGLKQFSKVLSLSDGNRRVKEQKNTDRKLKFDPDNTGLVLHEDKYLETNPSLERQANTKRLVERLKAKELLIVNPRRKNGLIIYKKYHAEFAGPGAIVGGQFDLDVTNVMSVGNISLVVPQDSQAKKQAYKMRRQWVRLTKQIIDNPNPAERAQVILNQFEHWFDMETVADLPDQAFALLVGVLPQTIRKVRYIELL